MHRKRTENPDAKRPKHPRKEYDPLIAAAWDAGWWAERSSKNYIILFPPDGGRFVPVPSTPSGTRTLRNVRAQLRKRGLDV